MKFTCSWLSTAPPHWTEVSRIWLNGDSTTLFLCKDIYECFEKPNEWETLAPNRGTSQPRHQDKIAMIIGRHVLILNAGYKFTRRIIDHRKIKRPQTFADLFNIHHLFLPKSVTFKDRKELPSLFLTLPLKWLLLVEDLLIILWGLWGVPGW